MNGTARLRVDVIRAGLHLTIDRALLHLGSFVARRCRFVEELVCGHGILLSTLVVSDRHRATRLLQGTRAPIVFLLIYICLNIPTYRYSGCADALPLPHLRLRSLLLHIFSTAAGEYYVLVRPLLTFQLPHASLLLVEHVERSLSDRTLMIKAPVRHLGPLLLLR